MVDLEAFIVQARADVHQTYIKPPKNVRIYPSSSRVDEVIDSGF